MHGLIGRIIAHPGQRDALLALLLAASGDMPGCLSYVVATDPADPNALIITEVWDSAESHRASLSLPAVREAIGQARPLIAGFGDSVTTEPVGGVGLGPAASGAQPLSPAFRLQLARAFRHNPRVDYGIDCVVEGQMGQAFVDDHQQPTAYRITVGPFWYFAGDATSPGGQAMVRELPPWTIVMPSPPEWIAAAQAAFEGRLMSFTRYSFSADELSEAHLTGLLDNSPYRDRVVPVDAALLARPDNFVDIADFDSPADFLARGLAYTLLEDDRPVGAAYSSLVCSRGIEVSLYVDEPYRRRGVATALAARLLLACLRRGLRPNWDAANPESCHLAQKLGYVATGSYDAYYYPKQ